MRNKPKMKISKIRIQKALTQAETFRFNGVTPRKPKKGFQEKLNLKTLRLDFHYDSRGSKEALD